MREEALQWWNSLGQNPLLRLIKKGELTTEYFGSDRIPKSLTGREIEKIYKINKGYEVFNM
jgi:hypothetical protein